jgi:hypothetical protein
MRERRAEESKKERVRGQRLRFEFGMKLAS